MNPTPRAATILVVLVGIGMATAAIAVLTAPLALPPDYSPLLHSVSESAAQQEPGAWLGRLGLLVSGLSVLLVCVIRARVWGVIATTSFALFGLFWALTAVFSTGSWDPSIPREGLEQTLHSVFATAMAVVVVGGLIRAFARGVPTPWRIATLVFVAAATFLPLAALLLPDVDGALQRVMFVVAYAWFLREALFALPSEAEAAPTDDSATVVDTAIDAER